MVCSIRIFCVSTQDLRTHELLQERSRGFGHRGIRTFAAFGRLPSRDDESFSRLSHFAFATTRINSQSRARSLLLFICPPAWERGRPPGVASPPQAVQYPHTFIYLYHPLGE